MDLTSLPKVTTNSITGIVPDNDVNLRDYEGRSALLLGEAKDQNASCALGAFIRYLRAIR